MSESDYKQAFAKNLLFFLDQNNMSRADLARALNLHESTVHSWVTAQKSPRMSTVDKMCKIFGCTRAQMTNGQTDKSYYINAETQEIAQEIYKDKDLRALFSAARDASPEDLQMAQDILKALKKKERGSDD